MGSFAGGEEAWINRVGNLRNTVRQEVMRRQLADHVTPAMSVLDVGCGQGTQAVELARRGCRVTGVEPSTDLRLLCQTTARSAGVDVELIDGTLETLNSLLGDRTFDVVFAHGLLMYLDDRTEAIATLARRVAPGGQLSLTFRNAHALAMRPAMRRDWTSALAALTGDSYVNELGITARADRLEDVIADLDACDLDLVVWYGVRVFNDATASDAGVPADENVVELLDAENEAGRRDPYRWLGSQIHIVARRRS